MCNGLLEIIFNSFSWKIVEKLLKNLFTAILQWNGVHFVQIILFSSLFDRDAKFEISYNSTVVTNQSLVLRNSKNLMEIPYVTNVSYRDLLPFTTALE